MPHEVIMPALGMAQDTGLLVAWLKAPGDAVAVGEALFEVETDKATMEVEAPADGYLAEVSAQAGEAVPVGSVIARIADSPEDAAAPAAAAQAAAEPAAPAAAAPAQPAGHEVIMPALGMAQDAGLLVAWLKAAGDAVAEDDALFEVETDKSTAEVPAGRSGYIAALLAAAGDNVPVGRTIAVISDTRPEAPSAAPTRTPAAGKAASEGAAGNPAAKAAAAAGAAGTAAPAARAGPAPAAPARPPRPPQASPGGRILASPKARRLAREAGLDLGRLAAAGHPQPYHVRDLEVLRTLPAAAPAAATALQARRLTAEVPAEGFTAFAAWAAENAGLDDPAALLAGLAAAGLGRATALVEVDGPGPVRRYHVPGGPLSAVTAAAPDDAAAPDLVVRDLRGGWIAAIHLGPEPCPVLSLADTAGTLALTLECAADALSARQALALVSAFAGRLSQPLRHLL